MSKVVKNYLVRDIGQRLEGVQDAILVGIDGIEANANYNLRKALREAGCHLLVVKRSLAARAVGDGLVRPVFEGATGSCALLWGCEDFVSLAKVVAGLVKRPEFSKLELKGGVMDGEAFSADQVLAASKWPSRLEQISLLLGQVLSPGSSLSSQLIGPGGRLASQFEKLSETEAAS